jgi:hypothetical protein
VLWSGRKSRTHSEQLMDELTQSYGHLKLAAGHAAGGAAEMATPTYDRARNVAMRGWGTTRQAFSPLYEQFRDGAASARKGYVVEVPTTTKKNRWPMLAGLLAAGAAVGAAGAIMARRRRTMSEWDEYEPLGGIDTGYGTAEPKASTGKKLSEGAASVAGSVSSGAGKLADSLHGRSSRGGDSMGDMAKGLGHKAESTTESMTDPARHNSRP